MSYKLEGGILEVCDCNVLCPCWVGETLDTEPVDPPSLIISTAA